MPTGATFYFFVEIRRKGFEQGGSEAEENASGKHFRRRGNERSEAIGAAAPGQKPLALRQNDTDTLVVSVSFFC